MTYKITYKKTDKIMDDTSSNQALANKIVTFYKDKLEATADVSKLKPVWDGDAFALTWSKRTEETNHTIVVDLANRTISKWYSGATFRDSFTGAELKFFDELDFQIDSMAARITKQDITDWWSQTRFH